MGLEAGFFATTEGLGRLGQPLDGPHLIADEQDGHPHQQDRGDGQPQDEDVGLGRHRPLARGDDPQHAMRLLHLDVDIGRVTRRIEPEGLVQPRRQRFLKGLVHHADGSTTLIPGQDVPLLEGDGKLHRALGTIRDRGQVRGGRCVAITFGRPGDVACQAFGQPCGHGLPVSVEEDPGHRYLHDQHRQYDDQQRSAPQRGRQPPLQESRPQAGGQNLHCGPGRGPSSLCCSSRRAR